MDFASENWAAFGMQCHSLATSVSSSFASYSFAFSGFFQT